MSKIFLALNPTLKSFSKTMLATIFWILVLGVVGVIHYYQKPVTGILSSSEEVQVTANVYGCVLRLIAKPEKRIPAVNNWGTILTITIYDAGTSTLRATLTTTTNAQGTSIINLCDNSYYLMNGTYDFYLKGYSHLRKKFPNLNAFASSQTVIDFSNGGQVLLAGETSVVYDNKINSLDLATLMNKNTMFTSDYRNDLNQDGVVNSLDFSNTIVNFYKTGD